jgi:hypothetical protein
LKGEKIMANVIHFDERYKSALVEGFNKASETDDLFDHSLDMEFSGVKTVHVKSLKTEPLQDYNRGVDPSTGSRYGATKEVGNEEQTFTMTQDRSLSLSVDKGNNKEVMDKHKVGAIMAAERDEHIIPEMDTYRLNAWAKQAGIVHSLSAALTKSNVLENVITAWYAMRNKGVNEATLLIPFQYMPYLILAPEWVGLDSLGGKTLPKGTIGQLSGMNVKPISNERMPADVQFMIIHKKSVISPVKIKDFKGHVDPPGLSGDLLEFRMIYDAFVLGKKAYGVLIAVLAAKKTTNPTVSTAGVVANTESSATSYYTTDGSDPRYSTTAKTYTGTPTVAKGDVVKAYSITAGKYASDVVSATIT